MAIGGGWETEIYSFTARLNIAPSTPVENHLILRMYPGDNAAEKCEREYVGMTYIKMMGYSVPRVIYRVKDAAQLGKPALVMEKIDSRSLGNVIREQPERHSALFTMFVQLLVNLHRLPYRALLEPNTDPVPADLIRRKFSEGRALIIDQFQQVWAIPIFDWLEARLPDVLKTASLSIIHNDFHPYNILLSPEDQPFVIDWSLIEINDYRFDLGWTLILSALRSIEERNLILSEYERLRGQPVDHIEYFEVIGALRRLVDLSVSLSAGADALGMRPDTVEIMRRQREDYQRVYDLLCTYTGLKLPEIERLLDTLRG